MTSRQSAVSSQQSAVTNYQLPDTNYQLPKKGKPEERIISHSYAGIIRIRFYGYDLSLFFKAPLIYSAKLIVQSSKFNLKLIFFILTNNY